MTATYDSRSCAFGPLVVRYDERVLTPRPWTLLQSRWAAELAADAPAGPLLELFAGAGQIGLAAAVLSGRALVQVEADEVAADYARANAVAAGWAELVEVRHGRIENALRAGERFSIVLADPPYLPSHEVSRWPEDPAPAIDGGADGLDLVRAALRVAAEHLRPDGFLLLQVAGDRQVRAVTAYVDESPELGLAVRGTRRHDPERAVLLLHRRSSARSAASPVR